MRCIYCDKPVFGTDGLTVPGKGPAHTACHNIKQMMKRSFEGIDISELTMEELIDLNEMVQAEINERRKIETDDHGIDLF